MYSIKSSSLIRPVILASALLMASSCGNAKSTLGSSLSASAITSNNNLDIVNYGASFQSGKHQYRFVTNAQVSRKKLDATLLPDQKLLGQKGRLYIYADKQEGVQQSADGSGKSPRNTSILANKCGYCVVVMNTDTNNLGIVNGEIKVSVSSKQEAENIAEQSGLPLYRYYGHLGTAFFKVDTQDVLKSHETLKQLNSSSTISVVEHFKKPL